MRESVHYSIGTTTLNPIRPTRPRGAWNAILTFLRECASVEGPLSIHLTAFKPTQWDDKGRGERIVRQTIERFGKPNIETDGGFVFPSMEPAGGGYCEWEVQPARFAEFRDYVLAGDPWPRQVSGPVNLHFIHRFQWRDPDGSGPLEEQLSGHPTPDGQLRSIMSITLGRKSRMSPGFWFPFTPGDPRLKDLLSFIVPIVPFRMRPANFRHAVPGKNGRYRFVKFDASELVGTSD